MFYIGTCVLLQNTTIASETWWQGKGYFVHLRQIWCHKVALTCNCHLRMEVKAYDAFGKFIERLIRRLRRYIEATFEFLSTFESLPDLQEVFLAHFWVSLVRSDICCTISGLQLFQPLNSLNERLDDGLMECATPFTFVGHTNIEMIHLALDVLLKAILFCLSIPLVL